MVHLAKVSNYIPKNLVNIDEHLFNTGCTFAESKVFRKIYKLNNIPKEIDPCFRDFIKKPLNELFNGSNILPNNIKYLIHTHTSRMVVSFGNSVLKILKEEFALLNTQMFSISLNNCASILTALYLVNNLLQFEDDDAQAIIISADISYTPFLQVIPHVSVLGDAASAVLVAKTHNNSICAHQLLGHATNIYGNYAKGSWLTKQQHLEFEKQYASMVINTIKDALSQANLNLSDINLILPHNVNYISWEKIILNLGINKDKCHLDNIARYGHCFGSDIFINLNDAINSFKLLKNDYYMLVTVGLGATVSAAVFRY